MAVKTTFLLTITDSEQFKREMYVSYAGDLLVLPKSELLSRLLLEYGCILLNWQKVQTRFEVEGGA
jgi:hypothetical protein